MALYSCKPIRLPVVTIAPNTLVTWSHFASTCLVPPAPRPISGDVANAKSSTAGIYSRVASARSAIYTVTVITAKLLLEKRVTKIDLCPRTNRELLLEINVELPTEMNIEALLGINIVFLPEINIKRNREIKTEILPGINIAYLLIITMMMIPGLPDAVTKASTYSSHLQIVLTLQAHGDSMSSLQQTSRSGPVNASGTQAGAGS